MRIVDRHHFEFYVNQLNEKKNVKIIENNEFIQLTVHRHLMWIFHIWIGINRQCLFKCSGLWQSRFKFCQHHLMTISFDCWKSVRWWKLPVLVLHRTHWTNSNRRKWSNTTNFVSASFQNSIRTSTECEMMLIKRYLCLSVVNGQLTRQKRFSALLYFSSMTFA